MTTTVIFVGHGTRSSLGQSEFHETCRLVEQGIRRQRNILEARATLNFQRSYLELAEPSLSATLRRTSVHQSECVIVAPLFLFEAGHMEHDIPHIIAESKLDYHSSVQVLPAVGVDERFVQVTVERVREAGYPDDKPEAVLLLGRGNRSGSAQAVFEEVGLLVRQQIQPSCLETGHLAGTGRGCKEVLGCMVAKGYPRLHVQPYLCFHGWLTRQIPTWLNEWQQSRSGKRMPKVVIGEPLGIHPLLVDSMVDRVVAAVLSKEVPVFHG